MAYNQHNNFYGKRPMMDNFNYGYPPPQFKRPRSEYINYPERRPNNQGPPPPRANDNFNNNNYYAQKQHQQERRRPRNDRPRPYFKQQPAKKISNEPPKQIEEPPKVEDPFPQ